MKLSGVLAALTFGMAANAITVSYDTTYDNSAAAMTSFACSDGANGLITKYGYNTLGSIKHFPMIGGSQYVAGWNSPNCGKCYALTYKGKTVNILAVDHTNAGFNIAKAAMDRLTNNQAAQLGRIDASVRQVAISKCGL